MEPELVEINVTVPHSPAQLWTIVGNPQLYPRFVRGITFCEPVSEVAGRGARYRYRAGGEGEAEIFVHRRDEHLAWSGVEGRPHRMSVVLRAVPEGSAVTILLTVLDGRSPAVPKIRRRILEAIETMSDHLSGVPAPDPPSRRPTKRELGRILVRAGVLTPAQPTGTLRQLRSVGRWGSTLAGGYEAVARRAPGSLALCDERSERTFGEVDERTTRLAAVLKRYDITEGARVLLMCRNHNAMVETMIACSKLGADLTLMNTGLALGQAAEFALRHRSQLVLADAEFAALRGQLPAEIPQLWTWPPGGGWHGSTIEELIDAEPLARIAPPSRPGRLVVLTSGTSGPPKGARRPTPNNVADAAAVLSEIPLRAGEPILVAAPLFHTWGLAALQLGMALRAGLVLPRRFDPEATLAMIERQQCTALFAVPTMLQRLLDLPEKTRARYDLSSLRVVASSGAGLPGRLGEEFMDAFGDILYNLYGSTEVSWAAIAGPRDLRAARGTAGRPPIGTAIRVLDRAGAPVPPGATGRIYVGNRLLFDGYTDGAQLDVRDGLMDTGDRGYLDANGLLFVEGREDEMIVSGGENVAPASVEEVLLTLPEVREAAVVGVRDAKYGQRLAAYLVLVPGARLDVDTVRSHVRERLARFAVPRDVVFVDDLPRNATGKVVKQVLRRIYRW
ncbi:AMP-binding protein [Amycolatopsis vastitatis]|uniref:Acyl-CoA synthetase n=1 Tax=Amycolatopsis vastitatis TaxID=1905142 RepID=A0A229SXT6_9PSEU|nr:AMP-binding protein [Amycolatopsis vastitatis]OXM63309.1 acyl-CoA synthetase [Amycolatopsis vastitatis]